MPKVLVVWSVTYPSLTQQYCAEVVEWHYAAEILVLVAHKTVAMRFFIFNNASYLLVPSPLWHCCVNVTCIKCNAHITVLLAFVLWQVSALDFYISAQGMVLILCQKMLTFISQASANLGRPTHVVLTLRDAPIKMKLSPAAVMFL